MNKLIALGTVCTVLLMISYVWAGPEEESITKTVTGAAKAFTDFPRTRDVQSILKFYTTDYVGISDGRMETLKDMEKVLTDLGDQIELGNPLGISHRVSNVKTQVSGTLG